MQMTKLKYLLLALCITAFTTDSDDPGKPDDSRFTKIVLDDDLNEPMELAIADDGVVYYIERIGNLNSFDPKTNKKKVIAKLNVRATAEDGLMGLALDPNFSTNHWLYLYFGDPVPQKEGYANVLCRFELAPSGLINKKEILRVPLLHEGVNHSAGSLTFDAKGNLYLSTGDNTSPFESDGYSPSDDRPGRLRFDALKSSGNTNDLRGKILRIHPTTDVAASDGTYTIPDGNLFPKGTPGTRPEIYVMGCRNPYRISVDRRTGFLYWGEVGPDAGKDSLMRGPRGHDEINQARKPETSDGPCLSATTSRITAMILKLRNRENCLMR
jgi:cytochrome c